ncbi:voltage-gated potassium channel [Aureococcus anophagefferens]|nr:voltage-gated potassium channel [Aureococcus anophagefferens]
MTVDMSPTIYFARDLVVQEGNSGDEMFFISNGMAEILLARQRVAIHVISDGCYFGEVAVLFDGKRTASIRTLSVTVMYSLSAKSLLAAIADFPEIEAYLQRIAKLRRDFLLELGKAFAEDTPLPEKDDPEDKLTGLYGFEEQASAARLTHANSVYPEFDHASKTPSPQKLTPRGGRAPGAPKPNLANSPSKGHLAMLKNQPTAELAILDDRPSVSFSPAEVLEAASQERAKKLHDKQDPKSAFVDIVVEPRGAGRRRGPPLPPIPTPTPEHSAADIEAPECSVTRAPTPQLADKKPVFDDGGHWGHFLYLDEKGAPAAG